MFDQGLENVGRDGRGVGAGDSGRADMVGVAQAGGEDLRVEAVYVIEDADLLQQADPVGAVVFQPREGGARKRIESIARANFAAQTQTHVAALDLMEARNPSDLARRLDAVAQGRFGLAGAVIALEKPGGVPFGWRGLEAGGVDGLLGEHGLTWLGPNFDGLALFGAAEAEVRSVALIRMAPQFPGADTPARHAICAFGSPEEDGFTPTMGCELVAFIARVVERTAERWPILN